MQLPCARSSGALQSEADSSQGTAGVEVVMGESFRSCDNALKRGLQWKGMGGRNGVEGGLKMYYRDSKHFYDI